MLVCLFGLSACLGMLLDEWGWVSAHTCHDVYVTPACDAWHILRLLGIIVRKRLNVVPSDLWAIPKLIRLIGYGSDSCLLLLLLVFE